MPTKKTRQILEALVESRLGKGQRAKTIATRQAMRALTFPELQGASAKAKRRLEERLIASIRGETGAGKRATRAAIQRALKDTQHQAATIYETVVGRYLQLVEAGDKADDPNEKFVYTGPVDGKIRDFCRHHVGRIYTRRQIDQLENDQLPDVFLSRGGWNCRHIWRPAPAKFKRFRSGRYVSDYVKRRVRSV